MCARGFHHSSYYSPGETCTECGAVNQTLRAEIAALEERQRALFSEMPGVHPDDLPF